MGFNGEGHVIKSCVYAEIDFSMATCFLPGPAAEPRTDPHPSPRIFLRRGTGLSRRSLKSEGGSGAWPQGAGTTGLSSKHKPYTLLKPKKDYANPHLLNITSHSCLSAYSSASADCQRLIFPCTYFRISSSQLKRCDPKNAINRNFRISF